MEEVAVEGPLNEPRKKRRRLPKRIGLQVKEVLADDRIFATSMSVECPRAIRELRAQAGRLTAVATLLRKCRIKDRIDRGLDRLCVGN